MTYRTEQLISQLVNQLKNDQTPNGSWNYPFESGITTDAYMIILLRSLEINDENLISELTARILSKQETNGAWKLFHDEGDGNISATVEAYYSLLYSGYVNKDDFRLLAAKKFVLANGGLEKSHMLTKIMLAITGQYPWPAYFPLPVEIILLPLHFPINFYDISVYGRANLAPIMILANKKYVKTSTRSPNLSDLTLSGATDEFLNIQEFQEFFSLIEHDLKSLLGFSQTIHSLAINRTKQYMLDHIEPDGTLYSYFSSTFLMIFALLSLGHSNSDPRILVAVKGLKAMQCTIHGHTHMQFTTATVWNTSLISYALQKAGVPTTDSVINKANEYLLEQQQTKYGDWAIHNPDVLPGGWGFSAVNTMNPDIDDSTASLRSISQLVQNDHRFHQAWDKGILWIMSMQNRDGGWPAFEKNVYNELLNLLPIEGGKFLLSDPSSADLTGRTLEFLGGYTNLPSEHELMKRGINWLVHNQEKDGSWYGRWGICYIYGTWASITGLMASGVSPENPFVQKSVKWLLGIQNPDGGWGESCKSDLASKYVPLGSSNLTQTAWALDALIAVSDKATPEINAGISYLQVATNIDNWTISYPVVQGMGGDFYIHYHSYQYIFPLLALTHYKKKFQG
ncbi:squalene--hopene cyclase [Sporosarcina sp. ANT_H38]|uniref:squalene--hopene cyclase n=1 Tax=Sporosarcina sp. ANT_H38 TaxID=2597358 RepID=UPI0011F15E44|nr:squalene--hopene cyclase [Sporosarcina sp. ANT_H38]KAA0965526.1 squalene--hopene cyclase [Sporosarcina sp. ANT_H38]